MVDVKTLHVTMEAFSEYIWPCQRYDNNSEVVIGLSALVAVKFGYQSVIESMLEGKTGLDNELKKGSPEESYPYRARQIAQDSLRKPTENDVLEVDLYPSLTLFTWAVHTHRSDIALLILELKGITMSLEEKNTWDSLPGAAREGNSALVTLWLSEDPLIDLSTMGCVWAFGDAVTRGHLEVVNSFLDKGFSDTSVGVNEMCYYYSLVKAIY
jgi:hypothetical protein